MNVLALELNTALEGSAAGRLLSDFGKRSYFPKGIIAQGAEAKKSAHAANATIGMAYNGGKALRLSALEENLPLLSAAESIVYAPTAGIDAARELWRSLLLKKNPTLRAEYMTLPAVVPGITAALSYTADLFIDEGQTLITSEPCWDNYSLIFEERRKAKLRTVQFLNDKGLDIEAVRAVIEKEAKTGAVRILLNFPNNPAGYSPTKPEVDAIAGCLLAAAEGGADVLAICDDAYFGFFYEEDSYKESIFCRLCALHEKILAVKACGPIKEDYMWGLRAAFVTFGNKALTPALSGALVTKMMGAIRSSVSCSNTLAQSLLVKAYSDEATARKTEEEKKRYFELLRRRYIAVRDFCAARKNHAVLKALPFNSGYFMSFKSSVDAEKLRLKLLSEHGIGAVSLGEKYLRIAFASVEEEKLPFVMETVFAAAEKMAGL